MERFRVAKLRRRISTIVWLGGFLLMLAGVLGAVYVLFDGLMGVLQGPAGVKAGGVWLHPADWVSLALVLAGFACLNVADRLTPNSNT